jgi:hypothetical protein
MRVRNCLFIPVLLCFALLESVGPQRSNQSNALKGGRVAVGVRVVWYAHNKDE